MNKTILGALLVLAILTIACAPTSTTTTPADGGTQPAVDETPADPSGNTIQQPASGEVVELSIIAFEWGFEPATLSVPAGSRVRLTATSTSGAHGIAIPELGVNTGEFGPGETKVVEFVADKPGEYSFRCNVFCGDGHREMKGTLIVEG